MIAIDWGTTNFRAYHVNHNQVTLLENSNCGIASFDSSGFEKKVEQLFESNRFLLQDKNFIAMSGMVGSNKGWHEVPYVESPVFLDNLPNFIYKFSLFSGTPAFIVPGLSITNKFSLYDVMRGEETQLLGLCNLINDDEFSVILPGTHSKHAYIKDRKVIEFYTMMSGELFSILGEYSILAKDISNRIDCDDSFIKGVEISFSSRPLSNCLFSARTSVLNSSLKREQIKSYLSGIIIGNEIREMSRIKNIYVVGGENISKYYCKALSYLGYKNYFIDGEACFLNGIRFISERVMGDLS
ncbi:2-dehydro-3-deoxygalactonokinase [Avibacterium paragallinarum]|uniref:2-dehydro-3-deoxygalactonokinase n=1 Tax=Avibacterium paragallinarum TaxID=728 RepID=UPI002ED8D135